MNRSNPLLGLGGLGGGHSIEFYMDIQSWNYKSGIGLG